MSDGSSGARSHKRLLGMIRGLAVALILGQAAPAAGEAEGGGVLLGELGDITAADLYDPATGKALLVAGAPLDPPPPAPNATCRTPPGCTWMGFIDSGILPDHPQLRGLVVAMKDFTGGDDPRDRIGHGTLVALAMVEERFKTLAKSPVLAALSPKLPAIVAAKVTDAQGQINQRSVIEAIHWVVSQAQAQGARVVINLSLGFVGDKARYSSLCETIAQYSDKGVVFAAAAGNFGPNVRAYPAACEHVARLASVAAVVGGRLWKNSGRGDTLGEGELRVMPPATYHYKAAEAAAQTGEVDTARRAYLASLAAEENVPALFGLAGLDADAGNLDAAYEGLLHAARLSPDNPAVEAELGAVRLRQERPAEAKPHLDRALELEPGNIHARANRGLALVLLGQPVLGLEELVAAQRTATGEVRSRIDALIAKVRRAQSVPPPGAGKGG